MGRVADRTRLLARPHLFPRPQRDAINGVRWSRGLSPRILATPSRSLTWQKIYERRRKRRPKAAAKDDADGVCGTRHCASKQRSSSAVSAQWVTSTGASISFRAIEAAYAPFAFLQTTRLFSRL